MLQSSSRLGHLRSDRMQLDSLAIYVTVKVFKLNEREILLAFTVNTNKMVSDVLMPRQKSAETCEIFAGFESRVTLRLKEYDI